MVATVGKWLGFGDAPTLEIKLRKWGGGKGGIHVDREASSRLPATRERERWEERDDANKRDPGVSETVFKIQVQAFCFQRISSRSPKIT